jgi:hypothetical protein
MAFATAALEPSFLRRGSRVAIRSVASYDGDIASLLFETLQEFDLRVRGKTVLLKPNFVGHDALGCANTHPAVVAAAREVFLRLSAIRKQFSKACDCVSFSARCAARLWT